MTDRKWVIVQWSSRMVLPADYAGIRELIDFYNRFLEREFGDAPPDSVKYEDFVDMDDIADVLSTDGVVFGHDGFDYSEFTAWWERALIEFDDAMDDPTRLNPLPYNFQPWEDYNIYDGV